MALSVPTTQQIADSIVASIEAEISRSIPLFPKTFSRVLGKAIGGLFVLLYKYAGWSLLQYFVQYASFRETTVNGRKLTPLIEWGRLVGVGDPNAASNAQLELTFAVKNQDGSTLQSGRQLVHPDSGVIYITTSAVTLNAASKTVQVLAASDTAGNGGSGTIGNRNVGDILQWANPVPQVSFIGATVTTILAVAADAEKEASYRARVLKRFSARPQGGAYADYAAWATEEPGILNAYPYTGAPGTVEVYIEATEASSGSADGIPTDAQRDAVAALIEYDQSGIATRRPVSTRVIVKPITRQPFDVAVGGLVTVEDDPAPTQAQIEDALDDYLRSREPYISGLSRLPRTDRITAGAIAGVVDDAANAAVATVATVVLTLTGAPLLSYTLDYGQKAKLREVTFT